MVNFSVHRGGSTSLRAEEAQLLWAQKRVNFSVHRGGSTALHMQEGTTSLRMEEGTTSLRTEEGFDLDAIASRRKLVNRDLVYILKNISNIQVTLLHPQSSSQGCSSPPLQDARL